MRTLLYLLAEFLILETLVFGEMIWAKEANSPLKKRGISWADDFIYEISSSHCRQEVKGKENIQHLYNDQMARIYAFEWFFSQEVLQVKSPLLEQWRDLAIKHRQKRRTIQQNRQKQLAQLTENFEQFKKNRPYGDVWGIEYLKYLARSLEISAGVLHQMRNLYRETLVKAQQLNFKSEEKGPHDFFKLQSRQNNFEREDFLVNLTRSMEGLRKAEEIEKIFRSEELLKWVLQMKELVGQGRYAGLQNLIFPQQRKYLATLKGIEEVYGMISHCHRRDARLRWNFARKHPGVFVDQRQEGPISVDLKNNLPQHEDIQQQWKDFKTKMENQLF